MTQDPKRECAICGGGEPLKDCISLQVDQGKYGFTVCWPPGSVVIEDSACGKIAMRMMFDSGNWSQIPWATQLVGPGVYQRAIALCDKYERNQRLSG